MILLRSARSILIGIFLAFISSAVFGQQPPGGDDVTFNPGDLGYSLGDGATSAVFASAVQSDHKIIIGGDFEKYNGVTVNGIARLNEDGTLDPTFLTGAGTDGGVESILIQPDGKIIVAGGFTSYNDTVRNYLMRLLPNGRIDRTFQADPQLNNEVLDMALQPDGKIIIAGYFTKYTGFTRNSLARLNSDGTLDFTFSPGGTQPFEIIRAVKLQPDGRIIIGGAFTQYGGVARQGVARVNTNGSLDTSFDPGVGTNGAVRKVALQANGKIIIAGEFTTFRNTSAMRIARLNANGTTDATFNAEAIDQAIFGLAVQPDGKILIGGFFTLADDVKRNSIARLMPNGSLDSSFDPGAGGQGIVPYPDAIIHVITLQADGKILIGGSMAFYDSTQRGAVTRVLPDGQLDLSFNPGTGANNTIFAMATQPDGKILIGGAFTLYNGIPTGRIARLNPDGSLDPSFNTGLGAENVVRAIGIQSDGKILIGGDFLHFNGVSRRYFTRLNNDGSLDAGFNTIAGPDATVYAIGCQPDGKILIGGSLQHYQGNPENFITRLNEDGSLDNSWNVPFGLDAEVFSIALQPDGKIILGGLFATYSTAFYTTVNCQRIARLNTDGTIDVSFTGRANAAVHSTAIQPDGKIIVAGEFDAFNGIYGTKRIVRVNGNGTLDNTFAAGTGANNTIHTVTLQSNGKIVVAGEFTNFSAININRIARLAPGGAPDVSFKPGSGSDNAIYASSLNADGRILIAGDLTGYNGRGRNRIAQLLDISSQVITFNDIQDVLEGGPPFALSASSTSSLPVSFSSSDPEADIQGNIVSLVSPGKVTITASQDGNIDFVAAEPVEQSFCINPRKPSLTLEQPDPDTYVLHSDASIECEWFRNGQAVENYSENILQVGMSAVYEVRSLIEGCASERSDPLEVNLPSSPSPQTITFDPIPDVVIDHSAFPIHASSDSGLEVEFSTADDEVELNDNIVTPLHAGEVTIMAMQNGNANFSAATPVSRTFCVNPRKPVLSIEGPPSDVTLVSSSDTGNAWFLNGVPIEDATENFLKPIPTGTYTVQVSVGNCRSDVSDPYSFVILANEHQVSATALTVHPNPASDRLHITTVHGGGSISVINSSGVSVLQLLITSVETEIALERLPAGLYVVLLQTSSGTYSERFIRK